MRLPGLLLAGFLFQTTAAVCAVDTSFGYPLVLAISRILELEPEIKPGARIQVLVNNRELHPVSATWLQAKHPGLRFVASNEPFDIRIQRLDGRVGNIIWSGTFHFESEKSYAYYDFFYRLKPRSSKPQTLFDFGLSQLQKGLGQSKIPRTVFWQVENMKRRPF